MCNNNQACCRKCNGGNFMDKILQLKSCQSLSVFGYFYLFAYLANVYYFEVAHTAPAAGIGEAVFLYGLTILYGIVAAFLILFGLIEYLIRKNYSKFDDNYKASGWRIAGLLFPVGIILFYVALFFKIS